MHFSKDDSMSYSRNGNVGWFVGFDSIANEFPAFFQPFRGTTHLEVVDVDDKKGFVLRVIVTTLPVIDSLKPGFEHMFFTIVLPVFPSLGMTV